MNAETKAKLSALRTRMRETGTDLVALGPGPHMQWLMGFHPHGDERPCLLLVTATDAAFLMPAVNAEGSREHTELPFHAWSDDDGPQQALEDALDSLSAVGAKRLVLDETMRADFASLLTRSIPGSDYTFTEATVGLLRMRKSEAEYAAMKMNAGIADRAMQKAFAAIRPGVSEREIGHVVKDAFAAEEASPLFGIIGSGPNGAFPHHQTGDRLLQPGDAVVLDIGAGKHAFSSDITRMAAVGSLPDGYAAVHAVVERAVQAALAAARPGVAAREVDIAARAVIADAGYGDYFVHRTGHGIGMEGHEPPFITGVSDTILEDGMTFSIEPGIYLPGRFGIRLEEIVILRGHGPEILSELPRDVTLCEG